MISKFLKTIGLSVALLAFLAPTQAQTVKIGYINYGNIVIDLPEYKKMNDSLMSYYLELQEVLKEIEEMYMSKQADLEKAVKANKSPAVIELEQNSLKRIEMQYRDEERAMEEKLAAKERDLLKPLQAKVDEAIEAIAKEKGFTMILDLAVIRYKRDTDDVENLVRAKLKIITKEESEKKRKDNPSGNGMMDGPGGR
jgi:outer membrane protein